MGYPPQPPPGPYPQNPHQGPYQQYPTGGTPAPGYPPQQPPPPGPGGPPPGMAMPLDPPSSYTSGSSGGGGSRVALIIALVIGGIVLLGGVGVVVFFVALFESEAQRQDEVVVADPVTPTSVPPAFDGVWEGRMIQLTPQGEYNSEWDLRLELDEGNATATGELYEQFGGLHMCSWDLTVEDATAQEMELSVSAIDREGSCVTTGDMWLTYDTGTDELAAYVEAPWPNGTTTSSGTLTP